MKLLRNRTFAVLLTAAVVVLSLLLGMGRSVRALRAEAVDYFEHGPNGVNSVQNDLEASVAAAANLCTVAERYLPGSQELSRLRELGAHVVTYDDYLALYDTATRLMSELDGAALSEEDAKYVRGFRTELESRLYSIQGDPYHQMAKEFHDTLRSFPVSLLRPLLFVDDLDFYV